MAVANAHQYASNCGAVWNPHRWDPTDKSESDLDVEIIMDDNAEDINVEGKFMAHPSMTQKIKTQQR